MANSAFLKMHVEGAEGLIPLLKDFEQNVRERIARKALDAAAKPIVAAAKAKVPRRFGALKASLGVVHRKYSPVVVAIIGAKRGFMASSRGKKLASKGKYAEPAFYAHLVEFGTKPHALGEGSIRVRRSTRTVNGRRQVIELGPGPQHGRMHPGARPKPFLRPAWDANKQNCLGIMRDTIKAEVDKELGKVLAKRAG